MSPVEEITEFTTDSKENMETDVRDEVNEKTNISYEINKNTEPTNINQNKIYDWTNRRKKRNYVYFIYVDDLLIGYTNTVKEYKRILNKCITKITNEFYLKYNGWNLRIERNKHGVVFYTNYNLYVTSYEQPYKIIKVDKINYLNIKDI